MFVFQFPSVKFATGAEPIIIGKPSKTYFTMAVEDMGLKNDEVFFYLLLTYEVPKVITHLTL